MSRFRRAPPLRRVMAAPLLVVLLLLVLLLVMLRLRLGFRLRRRRRRRRSRADDRPLAGRRVVGSLAVVLDHGIRRARTGDRGLPAPADHDAATAAADGDLVVAAGIRIDRLQVGRLAGGVEGQVRVRSGDDVLPVAEHDRVGAGAAEHDVVAVAERDVVGDGAVERNARILADDLLQLAAGPRDLAVVGKHDLVAVAAGDRVESGAGDDHVGAVTRRDLVVAAGARVGAADPGQMLDQPSGAVKYT